MKAVGSVAERVEQVSPPASTPIPFRRIALVGPPNSGKTTLFNRLTGLRQKVGNFPGVTVEQHTGTTKDSIGREVTLIDLPGVYGFSPRSEDERVTVSVLQGLMPGVPKPDAVIVVLDSTQLQRHLTFAAQVIELGTPTFVALNLADALHKQNGSVDVLALARELGAPVALVSAADGTGMSAIASFLASKSRSAGNLELPVIGNPASYRDWARSVADRATYKKPAVSAWTRRLDNIVLHKVFGPLIFGAVLVAVFQIIFAVGQPLSDAFLWMLERVAHAGFGLLPDGILRSFLEYGMWQGVTSVLVFLPQILLLFLVVGVLEDSGYLARAAVLSDRLMSSVGLNGKCFIPLLSAFGCAVPAIMATRTIESKRDRIATIFVAPFMTCSARLPVYTLLIAAFVPQKQLLGPLLSARAASMISLYVLGFLAAVGTAKLLKSTVLESKGAPFMMELPQYRWPTLRSLVFRLFDRGKAFVYRAGTVILLTSIVLWVLTNLPVKNGRPPAIENSYVAAIGHSIEPAIRPLGFDWKIGVGLVTSLAARETIVATLGTLHGLDPDNQEQDLQAALRAQLTPAAAVALVVFFAFAMQCMSTLAVVRRETNGWKWPALQVLYMTGMAYGAGWLCYMLLTYTWR